jgi:hypothetical protein
MTSLQRIFESETHNQRKRRLNNERQAHYKKKQKARQNSVTIKRHELGRMDHDNFQEDCQTKNIVYVEIFLNI